MRNFSAKTHVALGQTFLVGTLLLAAMVTGIAPDEDAAVHHGRLALAEALAVNGSSLVTQSNVRRLESTLGMIVERNDDLLSAAVRHAKGSALVSIDDHQQHWVADADGRSSDGQVIVPLWSGGQRWGQVELRFVPQARAGWLGFVDSPKTRLLAFMSVTCFVLFTLYLRKMLQLLDPSQAVPPHVRSALDTLAEGLLVIDAREQIVLANEAFSQLVGRSPDELLGTAASEIGWVTADGLAFPADDYPWSRALSHGLLQRNDIIHLLDGEKRVQTFILNCSPVLGSDGKSGGVLISLDDVTQLEEHKAQLTAAKGEAEAANQAKSEFLANMSHEIRTPMNAILGFTDVLRRGYEKNEADRQKYLSTIRSSGEHLLQLINDVLDLSKVESGHVEVERIPSAPHLLIHEVIQVLSVKAQEQKIDLTYQPEGPVPASILTDPTRLRQILTNLVSNAIRFTEDGGVTVVTRLVDTNEGQRLFIEITDSGIGIDPGAVEAIFDPFVQADTSITRKFGGTGLGLPISRRFARLMGGDIVVHSEPGQGSTFAVIVDPGNLDDVEMLDPQVAMEMQISPELARTASWDFPNSRVLVVDDGEENRELVQLVLEDVGLTVEGAENGREGVDKVLAGQFDLILMDIQMPIMDGYTATSLLREHGIETPIVALTANAMKGFDKECREFGCTSYLVKPVDLDALLEMVAGYLGGVRAEGPALHGARSDAAESSETTAPQDGSPLRSRLAPNPRFRKTIVKFIGRLEEKLEAMEAACEAEDLEELGRLAHWLKGSGGMVGFDAFTEPAATLEMLAREGKAEEIEPSLDEIRALAGRLEIPPEVE